MHADAIEYETPLVLKNVEIAAEVVLLIVFVTEYGPIFFTPFSEAASTTLLSSLLDPVPDPTTTPVSVLSKSASVKPASFTAS